MQVGDLDGLLERLRFCAGPWSDPNLAKNAADAIRELRAELFAANARCCICTELTAERDSLRLQVEALGKDAAKGRELWAYLREYGDAWGEYQDDFVKMGLLELVDMTNASEDDRCANCEGDCDTCYRTTGLLMEAALAARASSPAASAAREAGNEPEVKEYP
jgi:hypothetical protein